ncbi:hypothetical protein NDU88_010629 [Pleurodeles waltl]|uniref:Uncharacterized protein n=1 Tax=Pleurodeles waltl TaxID=8319 RepID=A0AAV7RZU4_PLEWA|nr:hypothetical protein NDU88_010629 [Pleurodeles waltl]
MGLVRFPGAPYPVPAIDRPTKQDPLGRARRVVHLTGGNTCGPGSPAIPRPQSVEVPVGDPGDRGDPR